VSVRALYSWKKKYDTQGEGGLKNSLMTLAAKVKAGEGRENRILR